MSGPFGYFEKTPGDIHAMRGEWKLCGGISTAKVAEFADVGDWR